MGISRQAYYKQCHQEVLRENFEAQVLRLCSAGAAQATAYWNPEIAKTNAGRWPVSRARSAVQLTETASPGWCRQSGLIIKPHIAIIVFIAILTCSSLVKIKSGISRPEQVWVADITYLPVQTGEAYLSLVTECLFTKNRGVSRA